MKYDEIKNMQWSFSRLSTFIQCPYSFYLKYVVANDDLYFPEDNFYAEFGSFVHSIFAKILSKQMTLAEASEYYASEFDNNVIYFTRQTIMDNSYFACANYLAETNLEWLDDYEIIGIEKEVHFKVGRHKFIGYIDLLLRDKSDGRIVIVDHKSSKPFFTLSGKVRAQSAKDFYKYRLQMYLYARAVFEEYGEYPKELVWHHYKNDGVLTTIPFVMDEYNDTLDATKTTIRNIGKEKEFPANLEYFYCNELCDYRGSCEYKQEVEDWSKVCKTAD